MASYNDIIKLRAGKAAYNIENEKSNEWLSFIPNEQFNGVLRTVIKSVRGNDIDYHKSFWVNGTYGTGKSHAAAVISHLLSDDVKDIRKWVDDEYRGSEAIRSEIYSLREKKRLLTVKLSGLNSMTHCSDLSLVFQGAVSSTLSAYDLDVHVPTDFEVYKDHIADNPEIWDSIINNNSALSSIATDRKTLIDRLNSEDIKTFHCVKEALRNKKMSVNVDNNNIKKWLVEVQNELRNLGTYNGLLIVWDEFTDVMTDSIGLPVLKELQGISEIFMNQENDSFLFLISHPSAFDSIGSEQLKQTEGRYHRMLYNMESVSAFKIMSRKFHILDQVRHSEMCSDFYNMHPQFEKVFIKNSSDPQSTKKDLYSLFPLHPGTANLATHYATVIGSSSRSVFEFLGQNEAIREFLSDEECFLNRDTISADFLWDYVLEVFQEDVHNYAAVTERFNSCEATVSGEGDAYLAIFKGLLLLNAFNNVSGQNNNGLITPSEENVHLLFDGTRYEESVDEVLDWLNTNEIIQRSPIGLFSVQYSSLPLAEIEEKKREMRATQYKYTSKIVDFAKDVADKEVKRMLLKVIRPYNYKFYSDIENESTLRSQIKNGRRETRSSYYFFAFLVSRNHDELTKMSSFAQRCATDSEDSGLQNIVFVVLDSVLGDDKYDRFIEYQASSACASSHSYNEQAAAHRKDAIDMVGNWLEGISRGNATIYINGEEPHAISMKHVASEVNSGVAPIIYPYGPDALDVLRQKSTTTFWEVKNSKEMVRDFIFFKSKAEFQNLGNPMRNIQYLFQDCLDDDLKWKGNIPEGHPFKVVCDKVKEIIDGADKSQSFDFNEKFSMLAEPPYGLYSNYAAMGMMAFALRPWVGKIFDLQGKPRDEKGMVDDIDMLFKAWTNGKYNSKLVFKFQTPEEAELCNEFIKLFGLNGANSEYKDVTSLKDARYAIVSDFLGKRGTPLWALKYAPESSFTNSSGSFSMTGPIKQLLDNIVKIISRTSDASVDASLISTTLELIENYRFELKELLKVENAYRDGFSAFIMQVPYANVMESEVEEVKRFLVQNLNSTIGYWSEEEVERHIKDWRLKKQQTLAGGATNPTPSTPPPSVSPIPPKDPQVISSKRIKAENRVAAIDNVDEAKAILKKLCDLEDELVLDVINSPANV